MQIAVAMKNTTVDRKDRRTFLAKSADAAASIAMIEPLAAQTTGKKTFTILHTNDLHSNFVGMASVSDYTLLTLNDDNTRGGIACLATTIGERKAAAETRGPVLAVVTPDLLPQTGTSIDVADMVELSAEGVLVEIKEWQAIMKYLQALPAPVAGELPMIPTDARAREQRFIRVG